MNNGEDNNLAAFVIDLIDDDVRVLDQLPGPGDEALPAHMSHGIQFQQANSLNDPQHQFGGGLWLILGDPYENLIEVALRFGADQDLRTR